jgi:hypothetical protein
MKIELKLNEKRKSRGRGGKKGANRTKFKLDDIKTKHSGKKQDRHRTIHFILTVSSFVSSLTFFFSNYLANYIYHFVVVISRMLN